MAVIERSDLVCVNALDFQITFNQTSLIAMLWQTASSVPSTKLSCLDSGLDKSPWNEINVAHEHERMTNLCRELKLWVRRVFEGQLIVRTSECIDGWMKRRHASALWSAALSVKVSSLVTPLVALFLINHSEKCLPAAPSPPDQSHYDLD